MHKKHLLLAGAGLVALPALGAGLAHLLTRAARAPAPPAATAQGAWCAGHGLPEAMCFVCTPALIEQQGTCPEHGVPEALCSRCNAQLIPAFKATNDWCQEHGLPESQCLACNPALAAPAPPGPPGSPEERRTAAPRAGCRTHAQPIQLASAEVVRQVGIELRPVVREPFRDLVSAAAEVEYPADRQVRLSSRVAGVVAEVKAELGQWVEAGAVVATIDAPELGAARADLAQATTLLALWERNYAREVELAGSGIGTRRAAIEADTRRTEARAALARAEQRLRDLGLTAEELAGLCLADAPAAATLAVRAPFAGTIVERAAVRGEVVAPGQALLGLVDTRTMWARLDVPEAAMARIAPGQQVVLTLHALRGERFSGRVGWVASQLDPGTRTLQARVELPNPEGRLRAHMFGAAHLTLGERPDALLVPRDAVQWEGCCNVVFVPAGPASFSARKVQLGGANDAQVEVLTGLSEGEQVVTTGAFLLKTELLKGSIGAGCCEGE